MTKSIFEYKDDQDWYLASFGSYNHLTCFGFFDRRPSLRARGCGRRNNKTCKNRVVLTIEAKKLTLRKFSGGSGLLRAV